MRDKDREEARNENDAKTEKEREEETKIPHYDVRRCRISNADMHIYA
jgi:hypothetical protein